jgi:hypothetical protein
MKISEAIEERVEIVNALAKLWSVLLPETQIPNTEQFALWLSLHTPERMMLAIRSTARKRNTLGGVMSQEHMVRYCSSVANNAKRTEKSTTISQAVTA